MLLIGISFIHLMVYGLKIMNLISWLINADNSILNCHRTAKSMKQLTWYFDFISPFAYLQWHQLKQLPTHITLQPKPILFAGLLNHWRNVGPAEITPKRRFTYEHVTWRANNMGIAFKMPPAHPFNPLKALRLCIAAGATPQSIELIFQMIWGDGKSLEDPKTLQDCASILNIDNAEQAIAQPTVKQMLIDHTSQAAKKDIFGVPSSRIAGRNFWGLDAFDMLLDYLNNPQWFDSESMTKLKDYPIGIQRQ
jgi:2-hydroxychromene-2-carboxylate isomerase